jgi:hypothetical protein
VEGAGGTKSALGVDIIPQHVDVDREETMLVERDPSWPFLDARKFRLVLIEGVSGF